MAPPTPSQIGRLVGASLQREEPQRSDNQRLLGRSADGRHAGIGRRIFEAIVAARDNTCGGRGSDAVAAKLQREIERGENSASPRAPQQTREVNMESRGIRRTAERRLLLRVQRKATNGKFRCCRNMVERRNSSVARTSVSSSEARMRVSQARNPSGRAACARQHQTVVGSRYSSGGPRIRTT